jgi:hypothetical protein
MSYIGKIPANAVLTTADLADGIVTAAKIEDGTVVAAEIASNAVTTAKINADAVTAAKIADNAISEEHLDVTAITGHTAETTVADGDLVVVHDASASALRKMTVANLVANAGGGKLLQVIQTVSSTQSTSTSASDVEIYNAAITPSATSSKILIKVILYIGKGNNETYWCKRDSTKIGGVGGSTSTFIRNDSFYNIDDAVSANEHNVDTVAWNYLDSPSSTSAVTYSIGHLSSTSSPEFFINRGRANATGARATSTLTLMEIAG